MIHVLRTTLIVAYMMILGPFAMIAGLLDRSGNAPLAIARFWVRCVLATCRIRVVVSGLENLDPRPARVYMSNHQSFVDVAVILATFPGSIRFVAKKELSRVPILGWAMALGGHLFVERGNRAKVMESLERGAALIKKGPSLCVFPEGSRSLTGDLSNFKNGGFQIAMIAAVPIIPISVVGTGRLAPKTTSSIDSGVVAIHYGRPIPTAGLAPKERAHLKKKVRAAILSGMQWAPGAVAT